MPKLGSDSPREQGKTDGQPNEAGGNWRLGLRSRLRMRESGQSASAIFGNKQRTVIIICKYRSGWMLRSRFPLPSWSTCCGRGGGGREDLTSGPRSGTVHGVVPAAPSTAEDDGCLGRIDRFCDFNNWCSSLPSLTVYLQRVSGVC